MTLGENIKRIRKERGLTQKELGKISGINEAQIRRYELGGKNSNPKVETIKKIADALNVKIIDLIEIPFEPFSNSSDFKPHPNKENILSDVYTADLLDTFNQLNNSGKQRAVSQVQLIAAIPEFRKGYKYSFDSDDDKTEED